MPLRAQDIMESQVLTVPATVDALSCARTMVAAHKGYAVVLNPDGAVQGIVTEWDFVEKVLASGRDPTTVPISSIATGIVRSCGPDTPAEDVVEMMATQGIRRMVVRDRDRVVGIITSRDVLGMFRQYVDKLSAQIAAGHSDPSPMG